MKPQLTTSAFGSVFAYGSFDHLYEEINMTVPGHFSTRAGNADEMSMRMMHTGEDFITCNLQGRSPSQAHRASVLAGAHPWWRRWNQDRWSIPDLVYAPVLLPGSGLLPRAAPVEYGFASQHWLPRNCHLPTNACPRPNPTSTHWRTICSNNSSNSFDS